MVWCFVGVLDLIVHVCVGFGLGLFVLGVAVWVGAGVFYCALC